VGLSNPRQRTERDTCDPSADIPLPRAGKFLSTAEYFQSSAHRQIVELNWSIFALSRVVPFLRLTRHFDPFWKCLRGAAAGLIARPEA
jgi:hypothetical protein